LSAIRDRSPGDPDAGGFTVAPGAGKGCCASEPGGLGRRAPKSTAPSRRVYQRHDRHAASSLLQPGVRGARGGLPRSAMVLGRAIHERSENPDRKSTRLNSSHVAISYAVFCLKKKKTIQHSMA